MLSQGPTKNHAFSLPGPPGGAAPTADPLGCLCCNKQTAPATCLHDAQSETAGVGSDGTSDDWQPRLPVPDFARRQALPPLPAKRLTESDEVSSENGIKASMGLPKAVVLRGGAGVSSCHENHALKEKGKEVLFASQRSEEIPLRLRAGGSAEAAGEEPDYLPPPVPRMSAPLKPSCSTSESPSSTARVAAASSVASSVATARAATGRRPQTQMSEATNDGGRSSFLTKKSRSFTSSHSFGGGECSREMVEDALKHSWSKGPTLGKHTLSWSNGPTAGKKRRNSRYVSGHNTFIVFWHAIWTVTKSLGFKALLALGLAFAMLGGAVWELLDLPDHPWNIVLDFLMCAVMALFLTEVVLSCIVEHEYPLSFFFWMDIVGTASMMFEISFMFGDAGKLRTALRPTDMDVLRTARVVKVAARAGRLMRLSRLARSLRAGDRFAGLLKFAKLLRREEGAFVAKLFSRRLTRYLSMQVFLLTVLLVVVTPLFSIMEYPRADLSMSVWAGRLEADYSLAYQEYHRLGIPADVFRRSVEDMESFYFDTSYFPYRIEGYQERLVLGKNPVAIIRGESVLSAVEPARAQNRLRVIVEECLLIREKCQSGGSDDKAVGQAAVYFDFAETQRLSAGMDVAVMIFIVSVMVLSSFLLSKEIDTMAVKPVERIFGIVREIANGVADNIWDNYDNIDQDGDSGTRAMTEIDLVVCVLERLAKIFTVSMQENMVEESDMAEIDAEGRGVLAMMTSKKATTWARSLSTKRSMSDLTRHRSASKEILSFAGPLPVDQGTLESWELDVLKMETRGHAKVLLYIFFDSEFGREHGRQLIDVDTFKLFHEQVMAGYFDNPYHNYAHGCDVTHTVFRILTVTLGEYWVTDVEQYALLISALCHDIGHRATTNPFLIETRDELALRYNDKSPLENMHCAKLFDICSKEPGASGLTPNVFKSLEADAYKHCRRVCVASILHTDLVFHFEMVKDVKKFYEQTSKTCDMQALNTSFITMAYEEEVLKKDAMQWFCLFMHLADVSNPLKPFEICKAWAWRVLDEFFAQGDEERRLGIPVGALNDRKTTSRPGSQHGFINFLVAPLVLVTVKLFPSLHPLATQMAHNLERWRDMWVEEASPSLEDVSKRDADVQKVKNEAAQLVARIEQVPADNLKRNSKDRVSRVRTTRPAPAFDVS